MQNKCYMNLSIQTCTSLFRAPGVALRPWRLFLLGCLVLGAGSLSAQAAPTPKPNIIVFLVDDMGWMDCGAYGSKYYETPNMDRLATHAMRFTDAYAQPLCSPTRACLLTGKYSARHGITSATGHLAPQPPGHVFLPQSAAPNRPVITPESKNYLEPSEYTLAEALGDAGWQTAHVGKWHLGLTEPYWPEKQGFNLAVHAHPDPGPPSYFSPYGFKQYQSYPDGPPGEYITDRLTSEAIKIIEANRARPFFLQIWHHGVHGPWGHKEEYTKQWAGKKDPRGQQANPIMASMLKSVDESLGRIVETLDRLKLTDNTIVIFNSDNGGNTHSNSAEDARFAAREAGPRSEQVKDWRKWAGGLPPTNNTPLRDGKGTLYEGGVRVPLMWSWPGVIKPGTVNSEVVGAIDLYPTLLEMLGVPRPPQQLMDGVSYAVALKSSGRLDRAAYFNYFPHGGPAKPPGVTVRAGDWKLIRWYETGPSYPSLHELYNLRDDLGESKNLATQMPDKVKELDSLIDAFLKDTAATVPRPNPAYRPGAAAAATDQEAGRVQGFVAQQCKATIAGGALRVEGTGRTPFLGTVQVKHAGPAVFKLRVRTMAGGTGKIQWRLANQDVFPPSGQTVTFALEAGESWQDLSVPLPVNGQLVHFRLYLPADKAPVEIAALQFLPANSARVVREWSFEAKKQD